MVDEIQPEPQSAISAEEEYATLTLKRVRKGLTDTFKLLDGEKDAVERMRLATAIDKLAELERRLSNRSLPPLLRAGAQKLRKSPQYYPDPTPIEPFSCVPDTTIECVPAVVPDSPLPQSTQPIDGQQNESNISSIVRT